MANKSVLDSMALHIINLSEDFFGYRDAVEGVPIIQAKCCMDLMSIICHTDIVGKMVHILHSRYRYVRWWFSVGYVRELFVARVVGIVMVGVPEETSAESTII